MTTADKAVIRDVQRAIDEIALEQMRASPVDRSDESSVSDSSSECQYNYDSDVDTMHPLLRTYFEPDVDCARSDSSSNAGFISADVPAQVNVDARPPGTRVLGRFNSETAVGQYLNDSRSSAEQSPRSPTRDNVSSCPVDVQILQISGVANVSDAVGDQGSGSNNFANAINSDDVQTAREFAERDPSDHISLLAGADVYFVEDDFVFFNFSHESTVKELDKSYRQLAISMHPDKNDGSVQAKQAFQYLQVRYERLKALISRAT